jgi:hypothetical protein
MQPDLPGPAEHAERPRRGALDDLRDRLARLPASHPSAPGYRDWPGGPGEPDPPEGDEPESGEPESDEPGGYEPEVGDDRPDDVDGPDEVDEPGGDGVTDRAAPAGPEAERRAGTQRPAGWRRPDGAAAAHLPVGGTGDRGPYRPWFSGEPPRPWFSGDPPGRSG